MRTAHGTNGRVAAASDKMSGHFECRSFQVAARKIGQRFFWETPRAGSHLNRYRRSKGIAAARWFYRSNQHRHARPSRRGQADATADQNWIATELLIKSSGFFCRVCSSAPLLVVEIDRKSTRLNSSHLGISYAVFCL